MKKYLIMILCSLVIIIVCLLLLLVSLNNKEEKTAEKTATKVEPSTLITDMKDAKTEKEVVEYIDKIDNEVTSLTKDENISESTKDKLKNTFITLTDFAFYGGKIKGKTFDELSDTAKEKVLSTIENIDEKINNASPGYKETIKETSNKTYITIKDKIISAKEKIQAKYKEKLGENAYNNVTDAYQEDKNNLKEAYAPIVDTVKEKTKSAYEKVKEKASSWYQQYKESSD